MFKRIVPLSLVAILIITAISCIKDELNMDRFSQKFKIEPGIAFPVGYGELTVNDLLKRFVNSNDERTDASHMLYLIYYSQFASYSADSILKLPDQLYNQFFIRSELPAPVIITDSVVYSKSKDYTFNFAKDEKIDSMVIKKGAIQYNILSTFRNTGKLIISSNSIRKKGRSYSKTLQISSAAGNYQSNIIDTSIAASTIYFKRNTGSDTSFIPLNFRMVLDASPNPLRPTDSVRIDFTFNNLTYKIVYGNIGYKNFLNQSGSISMNLFKPQVKGNIEFENDSTKFEILVDNSYGVPIKISLSNVKAFSEKNNITTNITFPQQDNPIPINYPFLSEIGKSKKTSITFNHIIPTMGTVINTDPSLISFSVDGYTDTTRSLQQNFITDNSLFTANLMVTLPMWFRAGDLGLQDSIEFDFAKILGGGKMGPDVMDTAIMTLEVNNGLPIDVVMQVYFQDSLMQVLDSMFINKGPQVPSAVLDPVSFMVTSPESKTNDAIFGRTKIKHMMKTKWAFVRATFTTAQYAKNPALKVKFYDNYKLGFNLYLKAKATLTDKNF